MEHEPHAPHSPQFPCTIANKRYARHNIIHSEIVTTMLTLSSEIHIDKEGKAVFFFNFLVDLYGLILSVNSNGIDWDDMSIYCIQRQHTCIDGKYKIYLYEL
jgi:hypothetical protein